jgi:hypothetical protein
VKNEFFFTKICIQQGNILFYVINLQNISEPLVDIFNKITKTGKFPVLWKLGYVTPVPKNGAVIDFDKVRPITLTPLFSKLYESFLSDWLRVSIAERIEI